MKLSRACVSLGLLLAACDSWSEEPLPSGAVTVTTYGGFSEAPGPKAGVELFAIDPDGTARTATTDAYGEAELTVVAGGSVVAMYPDQGEFGQLEIHAVLGVEPDDSIAFGDSDPLDRGAIEGQLSIAIPALAGAASYSVTTPCQA